MNPIKPTAQSSESAFETVSLTRLAPELARQHFHALLLTNPNYFGNLTDSQFKPILKITGDTAYESLGCVGYNPQLEQLRATINVKQSGGYSGSLCSNGSDEFVRFYMSYDNGATWQDQGLQAVNVFDVPGPKPLEYAVTLKITPKEEFCFFQNLPLVRAILSWNAPPPPASPNWTPVWGDKQDVQIQIDGRHIIILNDLLAEAQVKLPDPIEQVINPLQIIQLAPSKALSAVDLHQLYAEKNIPQHRYLAASIESALGSTTLASHTTPSQLTAFKPASGFAGIPGINLAGLIEKWLNTNGDTAYEQIHCVGLDPNTNQLVGILEVKQSVGYSGGPCAAGSTEYVAFWVDYGAGFEYAGTTSVGVHDFSTIAKDGLDYNVFLPIDLLAHAQPCYDGPKTATVRAVLSWNTPPSTTDPYAHVVWGNAIQGTILIPPGEAIGNGMKIPVLSAVGDVIVSKIGSDGRITRASALSTGVYYADAPFGGRVTLAGQISNPTPGLKYRIMRAASGSSAFAPVVNEPGGLTLTLNIFNGVFWTQTTQTFHADADGYYPYQDYSSDHSVENQQLGFWYSTPADSGNAYDLRLDLSIDGNSAHDLHSDVVTVLINNETPVAFIAPTFGECGKVAPGDIISGTFTATASDFGTFGFSILPPGPAHGVVPSPSAGASTHLGGFIADPGVSGEAFTLNTAGMDPCGYSLTVGVWDRTNVNSGQTSNYNQYSIGFCLQLPE